MDSVRRILMLDTMGLKGLNKAVVNEVFLKTLATNVESWTKGQQHYPQFS